MIKRWTGAVTLTSDEVAAVTALLVWSGHHLAEPYVFTDERVTRFARDWIATVSKPQ